MPLAGFWQSRVLVKGKIMSKVSEREKLQRDIGSLVDELSKLRTKLDQLDSLQKEVSVLLTPQGQTPTVE